MNTPQYPTIESVRQDALAQFAKHLKTHWHFKFDSAKRRLGCCDYTRKTISLSRHYVELNYKENPQIIRNTILHEIAHALQYEEGSKTGHNSRFYELCRQIGATPSRCCSDRNLNRVPHSYEYYIISTGEVTGHVHRKPSRKKIKYIKQGKIYYPRNGKKHGLKDLGVRDAATGEVIAEYSKTEDPEHLEYKPKFHFTLNTKFNEEEFQEFLGSLQK